LGVKITKASGTFFNVAGDPCGTYTTDDSGDTLVIWIIPDNVQLILKWIPNILLPGGSYANHVNPEQATYSLNAICLQSNLDGCIRWSWMAWTRGTPEEPWGTGGTNNSGMVY